MKKKKLHVGRGRPSKFEGDSSKTQIEAPLRRGKGSVSMASMNCLPDELLIQILSFLPIKQAASTSVLSKRWMTLFTFGRHDFDFDDSIFWHPEGGKRERRDIQESFRSFLDRVFALQDGSPIKKFSLKCGRGHEEHHVHSWISIALANSVTEIHLSLMNAFILPSNLYRCNTLVKLTLGKLLLVCNIPSDIYLPALKVLFLDSAWFKSEEEYFALFLAACPALQDLSIHQKYFPGTPHVISSKTIKKLSITNDCDEYFSFLSLDTPNVVHLFYSDYALRRYPNFHLDSLSIATLDLHFFKNKKTVHLDVTDLIKGIRNVKTLRLTSSAVEVISECCKGGLPVFKNLNVIGFTFPASNNQRWKTILPTMIENSPKLTGLLLSGLDHRFLEIYIPPNQVKLLRIQEFQGSANEMKHISDFLLKMKYLIELIVYPTDSMDDSKRMEITKELLKLPKASSTLTVKVI